MRGQVLIPSVPPVVPDTTIQSPPFPTEARESLVVLHAMVFQAAVTVMCQVYRMKLQLFQLWGRGGIGSH